MENIETGEALPFDLAKAVIDAAFLENWQIAAEANSVKLKGELNGWKHESASIVAITVAHGVRFIQTSSGRFYRLGKAESSSWVAKLSHASPQAYRKFFAYGFV